MKLKTFTVNDIRKFKPCYDPTKYLPEDWQGNAIDLLNIREIPFEDRLWVLMRTNFVSEKLMRLFAVWCARQVQHLMTDDRSIRALDIAEKFAKGEASAEELAAASDAARDAARAAAWYAASDAARDAARDAASDTARDAAWYAAWYAARDAARDAASDAARDAARAAARDAARDAASDAARDAAWYAARDAQENKLREMMLAGIETGDSVLQEQTK